MKQRFSNRFFVLLCGIILFFSANAYAAEWVNISGTVYYNGQPLCVMVLANGEYMFTDASDGRYDLTVPLDANGEITLFSFCDGLAPYKAVLESWEARSFDINMKTASPGSAGMNLSVTQSASSKTGWVKLSGKAMLGATPLCAMILANGQHLFTPADTGKFELEVPLDSQGNITLFGFCDGMQPYKQTFKPGNDDEYALGDTGKPDNYDSLIRDFSEFIDDFDTFLDNLPDKFDWRDRGVVAPAKNQGSCGSCWAFASTGAFESKIAIKGGSLNDLSEQQQVSCNDEMRGCQGGNADALKFWYNQGPMKESCTGYTADETPCSQISSCEKLSYNTAGFYTVNTDDPKEIKTSLYNDGPAYFRYDVHSDFMTFWNTYSPDKVYKNTDIYLEGGHAVLIIGWDEDKQAWLCKNSWGATAGPNGDGTFWIAYSGHAKDLNFGMTNFTLKGNADFKVKSPDGGEQRCSGESYNITWETGDAGSEVKIELYKDGSRIQTLAEKTANDGLYSWTVSDSLTEGSGYKIRITDYADSSLYDMSDSDFSVEKSCELKVKTPDGGEKWTIGNSYTIQWEPGITGNTVKIYLFRGKEQMTIVASDVSNNGSYSWTVPDFVAEGSDYKIYISLSYDSSVFDQSDGEFSISEPIAKQYTITATAGANGSISPSGAVTVNEGASQTFSFTPKTDYQIDNVLVDSVSKGTISSYTFSNVKTDHTVYVTFKDDSCAELNHCEQLPYYINNFYALATDNETEVKSSLYIDGPAYFRYDVYSDFITFWQNGTAGEVYKNKENFKQGGHVVLLIGWDDTKNAWLCRNSWGTSAGTERDGTFWIAYSGHVNDLNFEMTNFKIKGVDVNSNSQYLTFNENTKSFDSGSKVANLSYTSTNVKSDTTRATNRMPPKFDWRNKWVVTPAKDQTCGDWAFVLVGAFESKIIMMGGQHMIFLSTS